MPRFYIDSDDGKLAIVDEDGADYRHLADAEDEAMRALPEIAQSYLPVHRWQQISATVRDEAGIVRFRASLTLSVERVQADRSQEERVAA